MSIKWVTFKVNCTLFHRELPMTICYTPLEDGSLIPSPCNGCDNASNNALCNKCIKTIFNLSLADPTMQQYKQPIDIFKYSDIK